ncbi:hypothetical protein P170DRAFT_513267 [Aspergillus steynii IBT 23096]|uniref:Paramyosin n=1 Tax=Aspergillus steynii IBT 23096 TaxID=1392250 RepID=A0A2I2FX72_9EURO|nr:uncharacterized protein P170DRAFT_513267 [Aspergillus steynii IBT 23096]PLB45234.1 hypothetical protein P170DRAFT_513267 [Aspergillus steynii IBT 23096]
MQPESSLNTPTSRDPRLSNVRPPVRTSLVSLPAPQLPNSPIPPKPATPNDVDCDDFVRGVSGLVRATIQENQNKAEKEKLQKQRESTERFLKRAKAHPNFPATIDFYQRAHDVEDADIARVDKALEDSTRRQLEKELTTKFPSPASSNGKVPELEMEIKAAKTEIARLMERNQSLETALNNKISQLETTFKDQSMIQAKHNRDYKERLDHFKVSSTNTETKTANITSEIQDLTQRSKTLKTSIDQLWNSQNYTTASVAQNAEKMKVQQEKLDRIKLQDVESIRKDLYELKTRVLSFENSHVSAGHGGQYVPHAELEKLTSRVQTLEGAPNPMVRVKELEEVIRDFQEIHKMSDDLHFSEKEDMKKELNTQATQSKVMSDEITHLSNGLRNLAQLNRTPPEITTLSTSLEQTKQLLQTVRVGLHSLETRYNSLTTETVVKNMLGAMHEMYPNINQLTEQTNKVRGLIEKELPPVLARVDGMDEKLESHISSIQKDNKAHADELRRLRNDHSALSQSVVPLWDRFKCVSQIATREEFQTLRDGLDSLVNRVSKYPPEDQVSTLGDFEVLRSNFKVLDQTMSGFRSSFITQLGGKADDDIMRQTVDKARNHLMGRITSISTQIEELNKNLDELKAAGTNRLQTTSEESEAMRDNISQLQKSVLEKYQRLRKELDDIRETMESHASEKSPPASAQEDPAPRSKDRIRTPKQESPALDVAAVRVDAETSPALALREQKKKKKRPRQSSLANEEKVSAPPSESSGSFSSPAPSTPGADETPESRKKRKKKKRKVNNPDNPFLID